MAMITMKNGAMFYIETAWRTNMLQEAPGIICSVAGTLAGADMVGPGFEDSVRITKMVGGEMKTEITSPEAKDDMWEYDMTKWVEYKGNGSCGPSGAGSNRYPCDRGYLSVCRNG